MLSKRVLVAMISLGVAMVSSSAAEVGGSETLGSCTYGISLPRGGETWRQGTQQTISWTKVGSCSNNVEIDLLRDGTKALTISTSVNNTGSYRWTVSSSAHPGRDYSIRIKDKDDSESFVVSNDFTITNASGCTVEVTKPMEGDTVYKEEIFTMVWNSMGSCGSRVALDLYKNTGYVLQIEGDAPNNGEWSGTISGEFATGSGYSVRVGDLGDSTIYDSSGRFTIAPARPCAFEFSSPSDKDTWYTDETYSILWSSSGSCSSEVALDLLRGSEEVVAIDSGTSNSGEKNWSVPIDLESGHDYTIRIRDTADAQSEGFSEPFSILDAAGPTYIYWLDNVARLDGAAGSVWRSDVVLLNPGGEDAMVELWLFSSNGAQVIESTVRNGTEGIFEDVVGLIGTSGKGCLGIGSSQPLQVSGRIYNEAPSGTFGQYVHGWNDGDGLAAGQWGRLLQLRQVEGQFRTNLTVTNTGISDATVQVTLFDSAGNQLHQYGLDVEPRELLQDLEPFKNRAGRPNLGWGFAVVEISEGNGLLVSASVIDSRTNDGTTIPIIESHE
ncbi:MAG: hypothetical protein DRJ65_05010 [Acidobacteria bacterium]|nr:MAG: hypothetical protein DRJ65_05010 [Acidobacteriota bacterium]